MKVFVAFDEILDRFSRYGLIGCLFVILGLTVFAIALRWLGSSLMWIEPLVRHLVFLSAFLGGSVATSKHVHIKVDLLTKLIELTHSKVILWIHKNLISLFCFVVCLVLAKSGWDFYLVEKEFGAPGFLHIHSSLLVGIIPFGMGLIALRFFNQLMIGIVHGGDM
jgi:TRAP-type C4-dicarboxylate transport system permease small subunit